MLLGAFVGLLALLIVSGGAATRTLREMHQQEQEARHALADRGQTLTGLYISVEVYNEDIGRYIGYPAEKANPQVRQLLDRLTADISARLNRYPGQRQPEEAAFLQAIHDLYQRHLELYQSALAASVSPQARDQVLTMRSQILDWSGQLSAWNGRQLHSSDETLLSQFGRLQASLTASLAIALGAGLLLVIASMAYILRLERQTRGRYRELAQSRHELERLSSRLVDAQEDRAPLHFARTAR